MQDDINKFAGEGLTSEQMRKLLLLVLMLFIIAVAFSQRKAANPLLFRVGYRSITKSEFIAAYKKNNIDINAVESRSVNEYLELYINFNLKVLEAMSLGLDTNPDFISEVNAYREQMSKPYLEDHETIEKLVDEAYKRLQYDLRVSHILVSLDRNALPEDTLNAYLKISKIRDRIKAGESFEELAKTYSDDPSARDTPAEGVIAGRPGNAGDIGYFSAFHMIYSFENMAYNTVEGELSKPFRTDFGYHILKVTDKLPAMGTAYVSQIMILTPFGASEEQERESKRKIDELYERLLQGEVFLDLVRQYSQDPQSASRDGMLDPFSSSRMLPQIVEAISELNDSGDFSRPIKSGFGWHIIQLHKKEAVGDLEDYYPTIRNLVMRDARSRLSHQSLINKLKKAYRFKMYPRRLKSVVDMVDESIFRGEWTPEPGARLDRDLIRFASISYTQQNFVDFLVNTQTRQTPHDIAVYIEQQLNMFAKQKLMVYEDTQLENKYPEFRNLLREYHDGMLVFDITDKIVWSRAMEDTLGLKQYFEENRSNYMWDDRLLVNLYSFDDLGGAKDFLEKKKEKTRQNIPLSEKFKPVDKDFFEDVKGEQRRFTQGEHPVIDRLDWNQKGFKGPFYYSRKYLVAELIRIVPPEPKLLNEARGMVISDYQAYLERLWTDELRGKYEIFVDQDVLNTIVF